MKTSVVLSAYNGEEFIIEQLESIRIQTVPVDEVLILDDCSTDNTVNLCKDYISANQLANWRIEVNVANKGFVQNFYAGFQKAVGDIIFICDQDDVWCPNKVERVKHLFADYPDALSICSAFSRFWQNTVISKHVVTPNRKKNGVNKVSFNKFCQFHWFLGMTTAFKKEVLKYHYGECISAIPYDIAVNFIAVLQNGLYYVDEILVNRRSYPESTSNRIATQWRNSQFNGNELLYNIHRHNQNLRAFCNFLSAYSLNKEFEREINKYIIVNEKRRQYIENKSILGWFLNCHSVFKLYTIRTVIKDVFYLMK